MRNILILFFLEGDRIYLNKCRKKNSCGCREKYSVLEFFAVQEFRGSLHNCFKLLELMIVFTDARFHLNKGGKKNTSPLPHT